MTGLWGMNVHVPGQGVEVSLIVYLFWSRFLIGLFKGYQWFISIIAGLLAFALIGGYSTYRFMVKR
jgi:magnesium transporter